MPQINAEELEKATEKIFLRGNYFNDYTLKKIATRIKKTGRLNTSDQQALKNIADISGDMEDITKKLAELTEKNVADIEKIYTQVITDGVNTYKPLFDFKNMTFVPFAQNDFAKAIVTNWYRKTSAEMVNLSRTKAIGFTDGSGKFTPLRWAYQKAIDEAVTAVTTGTTNFNTAMRETIKRLGGSGVVTNYGSGVTRSLNSAIRQNILYGAKQAAQSYDEYVGEQLGLDGFEVDAHAGCRPSHIFMQGKMYSYNGKKTINGVTYEDGAEALERLDDYNCQHYKTDVLLGVSKPRYTKEELQRIYKETTEPIEYKGQKKTLYEWKQKQRELERKVRTCNIQANTFETAGDKITAKEYKTAARAYRKEYKQMSEDINGLYQRPERMRTYF